MMEQGRSRDPGMWFGVALAGVVGVVLWVVIVATWYAVR